MLNSVQISEHISAVVSGRQDFGVFEDWFRDESKNVHLWGDEELKNAVFAIEDVLSQYHFEALRGDPLKRELANAILPFVYEYNRNVLVVIGEPRFKATSATESVPLRFAVA